MYYYLMDEAHHPISWYGSSPAEAPILIFDTRVAAARFKHNLQKTFLAEDFGEIEIRYGGPFFAYTLNATNLIPVENGDDIELKGVNSDACS